MNYCENCGHKIMNVKSNYCSNCGEKHEVSLSQGAFTEMEKNDEKAKLELVIAKPKFHLVYHLLFKFISFSNIFSAVFLAAFLTAFFGKFWNFNFQSTEISFLLSNWMDKDDVPGVTSFLFIATIVFLLEPFIVASFKYLTYKKTEYKLRVSEVEYREGFMTENYSTIEMDKIIEVHLRKGFIQKQFNLGNVFLEIPASGKERNGINMQDLENSEEVYQLMKKLIKK